MPLLTSFSSEVPLVVPFSSGNYVFAFLDKVVDALLEQCQVVVFIADDLGFLGPGSPDLMTELCPPQDAA